MLDVSFLFSRPRSQIVTIHPNAWQGIRPAFNDFIDRKAPFPKVLSCYNSFWMEIGDTSSEPLREHAECCMVVPVPWDARSPPQRAVFGGCVLSTVETSWSPAHSHPPPSLSPCPPLSLIACVMCVYFFLSCLFFLLLSLFFLIWTFIFYLLKFLHRSSCSGFLPEVS